MTEYGIRQKILFARKRLNDIQDLIARNEFGTATPLREQLLQEFFFHLVGAIEYLAQLVNEHQELGIDSDMVRVNVVGRLTNCAPLADALNALYANTRNCPMPDDPYSDEGYIYRLWNYRHQVVHRGHEPFHFGINTDGSDYPPRLDLDPRNRDRRRSTQGVDVDLRTMLDLVEQRCVAALEFCQ